MIRLSRRIQLIGIGLVAVALLAAVGLHLSQGGDTPSAPGGDSGAMQKIMDHIDKMANH